MTKKRISKPGNSGGYSLVELLIVIAFAIILLSAAVPGIASLHREWALWGGARILEGSLQWGRMHAIASNTPLIFEVDAARQKFYWKDALTGDCYADSIRQLPRGIRFSAAPKRSLRFYQHGNAAPAGTYTVTGEAGSYSVIVSPGGRIRTQKN